MFRKTLFVLLLSLGWSSVYASNFIDGPPKDPKVKFDIISLNGEYHTQNCGMVGGPSHDGVVAHVYGGWYAVRTRTPVDGFAQYEFDNIDQGGPLGNRTFSTHK